MVHNVDCHDCDGEAPCCDELDVQTLLSKYREYYDRSLPDIEALKEVLAHLEQPLKQLESKIKESVVWDEESISWRGITVTYRHGYDHEKWNGKALNGYAVAHPEVLTFKTVTKVKPTTVIKVE